MLNTLAAVAQVSVPEWMPTEVLVVDNASTDATAEVISACHLLHLPVRYIHEPRQGKGYAYNAGMAAARGQVFLFTDDDVRPPKNWIEGMCGPILTGNADAVIGSIRLAPHLERYWLRPLHKTWLASTEQDQQAPRTEMIGANMAFAKRVLDQVPAFDTNLGPGALGFYDETLFSRQLKVAGFEFAQAQNVVVEHHFEESRLARSSFLNTAIKMGRSCCYVDYHWTHKQVRLPERRLIRAMLRLFYWRMKHLKSSSHIEGASDWEMSLLSDVSYWKQWLIERRKPRNYDKFGLVKRTLQETSG